MGNCFNHALKHAFLGTFFKHHNSLRLLSIRLPQYIRESISFILPVQMRSDDIFQSAHQSLQSQNLPTAPNLHELTALMARFTLKHCYLVLAPHQRTPLSLFLYEKRGKIQKKIEENGANNL